MKDGVVLKSSSEEMVGHVAVPFSKWREQFAYA
jgi:hypothetical protein